MIFYNATCHQSLTPGDILIIIWGHGGVFLAKMEHLDNLPMSNVEKLLKEYMQEQPDVAGGVLSSQELTEYIAWMVSHDGETHRKDIQNMLPYFTPDNGMTRLAEELAAQPDSRKVVSRLSKELAVQNDEAYLAQGRDISVGRMLRYFPSQWHTTTYFQVYRQM